MDIPERLAFSLFIIGQIVITLHFFFFKNWSNELNLDDCR